MLALINNANQCRPELRARPPAFACQSSVSEIDYPAAVQYSAAVNDLFVSPDLPSNMKTAEALESTSEEAARDLSYQRAPF